MNFLGAMMSGLGVDPSMIEDALKGLAEAFERLKRIEQKLDALLLKQEPSDDGK